MADFARAVAMSIEAGRMSNLATALKLEMGLPAPEEGGKLYINGMAAMLIDRHHEISQDGGEQLTVHEISRTAKKAKLALLEDDITK
jgi:hypothetical protein